MKGELRETKATLVRQNPVVALLSWRRALGRNLALRYWRSLWRRRPSVVRHSAVGRSRLWPRAPVPERSRTQRSGLFRSSARYRHWEPTSLPYSHHLRWADPKRSARDARSGCGDAGEVTLRGRYRHMMYTALLWRPRSGCVGNAVEHLGSA